MAGMTLDSIGLPTRLLATEPLRAAGQGREESSSKIKDSAKQFESLLIGQLMRSAREANGTGWLGTGEDQAGESAMELAEEQMAMALAQQGGLGLANMIVKGLERTESQGIAPAPLEGSGSH